MHNKYYFIMLQKDATNIKYRYDSSFLPIDDLFQGSSDPFFYVFSQNLMLSLPKDSTC